MKRSNVHVRPVSGGWAVHCPFTGVSLMFRSGAAAEEKAKTLASRAAELGRDVTLKVHDRNDALVASLDFRASPGAGHG